MKQKAYWLQALEARKLISTGQFNYIKSQRERAIFSIRTEVLFLLYAGVLLFTAGLGLVIYQNMNSIGHLALLAMIVVLIVGGYAFAYRNYAGFSYTEAPIINPLFPYVVLSGSLLTCVFFSYLQIRFSPLGEGYRYAALASASITLAAGYYFDSRSSYAIGITALAAFVGITATPQAVINNQMYTHPYQTYAGLALSLALVLWHELSTKRDIKTHFSSVTVSFALHFTGVCCLKGLFEPLWPAFTAILFAAVFYFYQKSYELSATGIFVFTMVYAYVGFNILLSKILDLLNVPFLSLLTFLSPVYFLVSIWLLIKLTKQFNQQTNDGEES